MDLGDAVAIFALLVDFAVATLDFGHITIRADKEHHLEGPCCTWAKRRGEDNLQDNKNKLI